MDEKSLQSLQRLGPREAYESIRRAVLRNPWGSSSEDMQSALEQVVGAGILTWEEIEHFEAS